MYICRRRYEQHADFENNGIPKKQQTFFKITRKALNRISVSGGEARYPVGKAEHTCGVNKARTYVEASEAEYESYHVTM